MHEPAPAGLGTSFLTHSCPPYLPAFLDAQTHPHHRPWTRFMPLTQVPALCSFPLALLGWTAQPNGSFSRHQAWCQARKSMRGRCSNPNLISNWSYEEESLIIPLGLTLLTGVRHGARGADSASLDVPPPGPPRNTYPNKALCFHQQGLLIYLYRPHPYPKVSGCISYIAPAGSYTVEATVPTPSQDSAPTPAPNAHVITSDIASPDTDPTSEHSWDAPLEPTLSLPLNLPLNLPLILSETVIPPNTPALIIYI